jgi:replicative DNA helicase
LTPILPNGPTMTPATPPTAPHSQTAERTTLGALLTDPDRVVEIAPILSPDDFFDPVHRAVYAAIRRLYDEHRAVDYVTVASELNAGGVLENVGGTAFLAELCNSVPTSSHAQFYAEIVKDKAVHRQLLTAAAGIRALGEDESIPAAEALERAEQRLLALSRTSVQNRPQHIAAIGAESFERYAQLQAAEDKASLFGLTTGFRDLDSLLTGLPPGCLVIVAARPSVGKSCFALDLARHAAAAQGKDVAVFSLEMTKQEIMDRVIAGYLGVAAWKLKKGQLTEEEFGRMGTLFDELKRHPLYIDDDPDTTITNLRSKARRQKMEHGLDLLVIDYLQLIEVTDRAAGENRTQQVSHISRSLKNLARELQCPIVALSQLSRAVEQRNPPIPVLSDLRESGGLEQDSDVVLMLYREEVYDEDCGNPGHTDVFVRKNRHGPTGRISLFFDKERMSFRDSPR